MVSKPGAAFFFHSYTCNTRAQSRVQDDAFGFIPWFSSEDYDEFGNLIGADLDSEDSEEEMEMDFGDPRHEAASTLEGYYEEEPIQTEEAGALVEVGGK
ncbi:hypothetical protein J3R83DRAFT_10279 [Lanmaoa asiatica]|nr:hypothetical protein J3R83DRAFT_10279 [Lanmaoa asiatica]